MDSQQVLRRLWFGYASRAGLLAAIETTEEGHVANGVSEIVSEGDGDCRWLVERLLDYCAGQPVCFDDVAVDTQWMSPFQRSVVRATRKIRYGRTASYGEIAARAGSPAAARAVGSVMAHNRCPLVIPCHRVVASGRALGGFSSIDGVAMKRRLLQLEGSLEPKSNRVTA